MLTQLICNTPGDPPSELVGINLTGDAITAEIVEEEAIPGVPLPGAIALVIRQPGNYQVRLILSEDNLAILRDALAPAPDAD
jgi:hypothetical protein